MLSQSKISASTPSVSPTATPIATPTTPPAATSATAPTAPADGARKTDALDRMIAVTREHTREARRLRGAGYFDAAATSYDKAISYCSGAIGALGSVPAAAGFNKHKSLLQKELGALKAPALPQLPSDNRAVPLAGTVARPKADVAAPGAEAAALPKVDVVQDIKADAVTMPPADVVADTPAGVVADSPSDAVTDPQASPIANPGGQVVERSKLGAVAVANAVPPTPVTGFRGPKSPIDLDEATWSEYIALANSLKDESERLRTTDPSRSAAKLREAADIWNYGATSNRFAGFEELRKTARRIADTYMTRANDLCSPSVW